MDDSLINQVILPVGEILSIMKASSLRSLLNHQLAVGRAIGGAALAHRFVKENDATPKDLQIPGNDRRLDVRLAFGRALLEVGPNNHIKTFNLASRWIKGNRPRLQATALIFLPGLIQLYQTEVTELLAPLDQNQEREVRAALVKALTAMAREGLTEPVLGLLSNWSCDSHPNSWVICRTISASWVLEHPSEVKSILPTLQRNIGESSDINKAIKTLKRHGVAF